MKHRNHAVPLSENKHLLRWVDKMAELTKPAAIHWVDGSEEERDRLYAGMIANGTLIKLNQKLWPGCYYAPLRCRRCRAGGKPHVHLLALAR